MAASPVAPKVNKVVQLVKDIVHEVATLQRPVTASAVALFILQVTGVTGIDAVTLAGILGGVGVADAAIEKAL